MRLTVDFSLRVAARLCGALLQAVTLICLARLAGPVDFGLFVLWAAITLVVGSVLSFGTSTRVLRVAAEQAPLEAAAALARLRWVTAALTAIAVASAAYAAGVPLFAWIGIASSVIDLLLDFEVARLAGLQRPGASSALILVQRTLPAVGAALALALSTPAFALAPLGGLLVAACVLLVRRNRSGVRMWSLLRTSTGFWGLAMVANLNQLEPLILRAGFSLSTIGTYAAASRVSNPLTIVVSALQTVFVPHLAQAQAHGAGKKAMRLVLIVAASYAGLLVLLAPVIVIVAKALFGAGYGGIEPLMYSFVLAAAVSAISQALQIDFIARNRAGLAAVAIAAGTVAGLASLLVIGAWGGAALLPAAPIVAQASILTLLLVLRRRLVREERRSGRPKEVITSGGSRI